MLKIGPLLMAVALALLDAGRASATPRDLTVQVSSSGLQFLDQEIPAVLPTSFSHPGFTKSLFGCPFGSDTHLTATDVQAKVNVGSINTTSSADGRIRVKLQASASGSLYGAASPCYLPEIKCRFDFYVSSGEATASFIPEVSGDSVHLGSPTIDLQISNDAVSVQASSCGMISNVLNGVLPLIKGWVLGYVEDRIEEVILQNVPPTVEKTLSGFTHMSGQLNGFSVSGKLEETAAKSDGVALGIGLSITNTKSTSCPLSSAPMTSAVSSSPNFSWQGEHVGLAISRTAVEKALLAAWKSGMFCMSDEAMAILGPPQNLKNFFASFFGLSSAKTMALHTHQAPKLTLSPGSDARLDLLLPGTEVRIAGDGPKGAAQISAVFDLKLSMKLRLDPDSRALTFELVSTSVGTPKLSASDDAAGLKLDPAIFTQVVSSILLPMVENAVNGMQLMPQVLRKDGGLLDPYYLYVARGVTTAEYITAYARVYRKPESDYSAPSTTLDKRPGPLVAPQIFRFVAHGSDNQTPGELLRFSWRVDGGSWSSASYSRAYGLSLIDGKHTVEARAVDLNGNQDGSPASATFEVDGVRPTIKVTTAPQDMVSTGGAVIAFSAKDDRTPPEKIGVSVRVERRRSANEDFAAIDEEPFLPGRQQLSLRASQAGDYRITLISRDEAGNLSEPATVQYSSAGGDDGPPIDSDDIPRAKPGGSVAGGCTAVGGRPGLNSAWVLLLLAVLTAAYVKTARKVQGRAKS